MGELPRDLPIGALATLMVGLADCDAPTWSIVASVGGALNAVFRFVELKCAGFNIVQHSRRDDAPQADRKLRSGGWSSEQGYPYKRVHLLRLRKTNISSGAVSRGGLRRCYRIHP
jgi:hypothetical protein